MRPPGQNKKALPRITIYILREPNIFSGSFSVPLLLQLRQADLSKLNTMFTLGVGAFGSSVATTGLYFNPGA
jgi:hypothetical protein